MTEQTNPGWEDWEPSGEDCPACGKTMLDGHEYRLCYSCTPNERIARDAAKKAGPTAREREVQLEIEDLMERYGEVEIELRNEHD